MFLMCRPTTGVVMRGLFTLDWNKAHNRRAHHTDRYEMPRLIVRRGQLFNIDVTLRTGSFNLASRDTISFAFTTGTS